MGKPYNQRSKLVSLNEIINQSREKNVLSAFSHLKGWQRKRAISNAIKLARRRSELMKLLRSDMSEAEIAGLLNVSRERVRQWKKKLMPERRTLKLAQGMPEKIAELARGGMHHAEIAKKLGIKEQTAKRHAMKALGRKSKRWPSRDLTLPKNVEKLEELFKRGWGDMRIAEHFGLEPLQHKIISRMRIRLGFKPVRYELISKTLKARWAGLPPEKKNAISNKRVATREKNKER